MDNCFEEMDRTSAANDNDNVNVDHGNDENHDNNDGNDDDNMMSDYNLAIGEYLPIVSLKRRSATPGQVLNDDETNFRVATADSIIAAVISSATATATARPTQPRSITPNLFLPILVQDEDEEGMEDENRDESGEGEGEGEGEDNKNVVEEEEVRTEGMEGNTDDDNVEDGKETQTETQTFAQLQLFPTTKTTVVPAVVPALPLPLLLSTPQQHKPNAEATYDDIICHYNSLIQKQRCTPRSTTPRTPKQQQYESLSYSSSSNEGKEDGKKNGASTTHSAQPLLLSPYFLFTPDVISSQDEYVIPHDPPALVITNTVPRMNVDNVDEEDTMERQLCAQLSKIPSISKVLEEAEAVAVDPHYTDQVTTTSGVSSSLSFINNKATMTTQPSSVRPLRMRRRETTMTSGIFRTSIVGLGGVGSNGTTAMPLLRKSSHRTTTMTKPLLCVAPVVPPSIDDETLYCRSPPDVRKQRQQKQHVQ